MMGWTTMGVDLSSNGIPSRQVVSFAITASSERATVAQAVQELLVEESEVMTPSAAGL